MPSEKKLLDIFVKLNSRNKLEVLIFARLKVVRQVARNMKPYVRERRACMIRRRPVHWVGLGG